MARYIYHVRSWCKDPAHEQEMNDWYNNVHIPDCITCPGYISVTRYEIVEQTEKSGKYLTIYEIESDDIDKTMAIRRERREKEKEQGRAMAQLVPNAYIRFWHDVQFKKIYELSNK